MLVLCVLSLFTNYGGAKFPRTPPQQEPVISYSSTGFALDLPGAAQAETAFLSSNQLVSGYAVVSYRQISSGWTSNTNGLTLAECERWSKMGVAEDTWWYPFPAGAALTVGTNLITEGVHIGSTGLIGFSVPKSSPVARALPLEGTASDQSFLAVLQGPSGLIPPAGRVTAAFTSSNSLLVSWHNLQLGRETNANSLATAQAEIMSSGDIFCRYCLPTNNFALTNYVVGIQNQTGGSSYSFALTNAVFENSELLFKNFGYLDPAISDHDNDGLSSALEVLVHHTNPHMADSDLDGLSDGEEIAAGTDPNNRDTDGDGIPDGSDPFPLIGTKLDLDHDGLDDNWEIYWFGSTNVTDSGANDSNGNGRSDLADLLAGNNAAFAAYAVTTTHGANLFSCTSLPGATNYSFYAVGDDGTQTNVIAAATNSCSILVTGCGFTNGMYALYACAAVDSANKAYHITGPVMFEQPVQPNRTVYSITPTFALQSPSKGMTVIERTFSVNRTRAYNQYYIASDVNAGPDDLAGDWALEGLTLEWSDSTGAAGVTNASPINDTLLLDTGTNAAAITVALRTTGSNGLARCIGPLYLIEWTPTVTIDTNATLIVTEEGSAMVLISNQQGGSTESSFSVNTKGCPSRAALTADQQAALNDPFGDGGDSFNLQTDASGLITGGSFISGASGVLPLVPPSGESAAGAAGGEGGAGQGNPGTAGQGPLTLYRITPVINYYNSGSSGNNFCECGNAYPFDTACLKKQWLYSSYPTNVCSEGGHEGVEVTLGLSDAEAEKFGIFVNNEKGAVYNWKDSDIAANATVSLSSDELWSSGLIRLEMTDRGAGYWGNGPAASVTTEDDRCGCDDGCVDGDCNGNDGPDLGSLKFRLSLGQNGFDQSGGFIWFKCETLPATITPELFNVTALPSVNITSNATAVTQVDNPAVNGRCIDVSTLSNPDGVKLTIYRYGSKQEANLEGSWEITRGGAALSFVGKDANNNPRRHLTYSYDVDLWIDSGTRADRRWRETDTLTGKVRNLLERDSGQNSKKTWLKTKDIDGNIHYGIQQEYTTIGNGTAAVERVESRSVYGEYGDGWYTTSYYYHADNLNPQVNGKIKVQKNPDCSWEYYLWESSGRETLSVVAMDGCVAPAYLKEWAPDFNFNPGGSYPDLDAKITQYSYTTHAGDGGNWRDAAQPRTVAAYRVSNGTPVLTARTWHKYQRGTTNLLGTTCSIITHTAIRAASQNSAITDPANRISVETSFIETYSGSRYLDGRPLYQKNEDGSTTTWEYELDNTEGEFTVVTYTGTESNPKGIAGRSTYEVEVADLYYGHTLSRGTALYCGAQEDILLSSEQNYYDDKGRLTSTEYSDGTSRFNLWSCCRLLESIARDGSATEYWEIPGTPLESESYNSSLGALPGANGLFPINGSVVDLMGRTTNSYQAVGNGAVHSTDYAKQVTTTEYPEYASHFRVTTDPLGVVTTNRTSINYSGRPCIIKDETIRAGVTTTAVRLDNGEPETTIEWTDSVSGEQLKKMTKTESDIQPNGWKKTTSYVKYDDGEWLTQSETTHDFLGRVVASSRAGTGGAMLTTSNLYNNAGLLVRTISHDGSSTVLDYNELGERTATISIAAGQTLDFDPLSFTLANVVLLDKYVINLTTESLAQHSRNQFFISHRGTEFSELFQSFHQQRLKGVKFGLDVPSFPHFSPLRFFTLKYSLSAAKSSATLCVLCASVRDNKRTKKTRI
ncbi:MAG: hypothetical protein WC340_15175 [Kiritimatiellia bacterium]